MATDWKAVAVWPTSKTDSPSYSICTTNTGHGVESSMVVQHIKKVMKPKLSAVIIHLSRA